MGKFITLIHTHCPVEKQKKIDHDSKIISRALCEQSHVSV